MRRVGLAVVSVAVLAGTSAHAADVIVNGTVGAEFTIAGGNQAPNPPVNPQTGENVQVSGALNVASSPNAVGGSYTSFLSQTPTTVSFESAGAAAGTVAQPSAVTSFSTVNLTFQAGANAIANPTLSSTIIPAGFGFYLANTGCGAGNVFTGCSAADATFGQLFGPGGEGQRMATVSFAFDILDGDGGTLYSTTGSLEYTFNANGGQIDSEFFLNDGVQPLTLHELSYGADPQNGLGNNFAYGYAWDSLNVFLDNLDPLAAFETRTIQYRTTVTVENSAGCIPGVRATGLCLIAYAGFGDPIGRGGDANLDFASVAFAGGGDLGFLLATDVNALVDDGINGLGFQQALFNRPTFDPTTGALTFTLFDGQTRAVPEPATWVSLIAGFGLLGAAMRRRRALVAA